MWSCMCFMYPMISLIGGWIKYHLKLWTLSSQLDLSGQLLTSSAGRLELLVTVYTCGYSWKLIGVLTTNKLHIKPWANLHWSCPWTQFIILVKIYHHHSWFLSRIWTVCPCGFIYLTDIIWWYWLFNYIIHINELNRICITMA